MPSRRLASFEIRNTPLVGFIPAGLIAIALGFVAGRQPTGAEFRYLPVRLAVISLVCAVAFVFDDPAKATTDPAASPLRIRRGIRALTGVIVASCLFVIVLTPASTDMSLVIHPSQAAGATDTGDEMDSGPELPWGRPAIEMATMIGLTLATAGAISRRGENEPGRIAAGIVLGAYALSWMIPESFSPWADPLDQRWTTGSKWWWATLIIAWVSALILSWDSRVGRLTLRSGHDSEPAMNRHAG